MSWFSRLCCPTLGHEVLLWGPRVMAALVAIAWWREAKKWDEVVPKPVP
jgi:hypothetical protein